MAENSSDHVYDVIVIGAGISGLSAAYLLDKKGIKNTLVLEARDRVGGRTYTIKDAKCGYTDLGGAYVGRSQFRILRMAKELGVELYDVDDNGKTVMNIQGYWKTYQGEIPPLWNPIHLLDLNHAARTIDDMALQVPLDCPWLAEKAEEWDKITVHEFIESLVWTKTAKELLKIFVRLLFGAEMHELSFLYFLWCINSGQGLNVMASIRNGAQEKKFIGGSQQISEKLMERLGNRTLLSSPVILVDQGNDGVQTVKDSFGQIYKTKYVISAIPQTILNRIQFIPTLPALKQQLIQRIPMNSIIKTIMFYEERFWKKMDLNGSLISDVGPVNACIDDTKPDGTYPAILGFIVAKKSRQYCEMSKDGRKIALCNHYASVFKNEKFLEPVHYEEMNWMNEEYSGGCYSPNMPPGVLTEYGGYLSKPFGHVFFAGTETATCWLGYMDGAIQAGERAANQVLHDMGLISEKDIEAREPESKEYPVTPVERDFFERNLPSVTAVLYFFVGLSGILLATFMYR